MKEVVVQARKERVVVLAPLVVREVLFVERRSGLKTKPLDPFKVKNQAQFGRGEDDAAAMAQVHAGFGEFPLGMRTTTIRNYRITTPDGESVEVQESKPSVKNEWISWAEKQVTLLTKGEAKNISHSGRTGLEWASNGKTVPDRVVRASNGFFYPATSHDIVVKSDSYAPW